MTFISKSSRLIGFSYFCTKRKEARDAEQYSICGNTREGGTQCILTIFEYLLGVNEHLEGWEARSPKA